MKPLLPCPAPRAPGSFWPRLHPLLLAVLPAFLLLGIGPLPLGRAQERVVASPAAAAAAASAADPGSAAAAKGNLLAVIKAAGKFNTLLKILDATGLSATLEQPGPYTVFAPSDAAFAKLPPGTLDRLMKLESKPKLVAIMSYHIAPGKVEMAALSKMDELKTLDNGEEIDVDTSTDGKTIEMDDSKIVGPQIEATNGVVHEIDAVLQP
jgi:uncharacterized surface protein with fasciclin (FAS1) repeats